MTEHDEAEWRGQVDTDLRKLDAAVSRIFTKQEATDDKIDAQNVILTEIRRDIGTLKQGPELWRYGTMFVATIAAAWFLVETKVESATKDALMADAAFFLEEVEPRINDLEQVAVAQDGRISQNTTRWQFQWSEMKDRSAAEERRDFERADALDRRITERFSRNETVLERLRAARERDLVGAEEAATADKDMIERQQMDDLRRALERLETAVGHLRAAFPHNLPGGDG